MKQDDKIMLIAELVDHIEEIDHYFDEAPMDYGDRKDGFEGLLYRLTKNL